LLERGPYCKTDILTEKNPFKVLSDSRRVVKEYQHEVVQGAVLGGGSAVNNYAWITPSHEDVANGFGAAHADAMRAHIPGYEQFIDGVADRAPPHMLHKLLTMDLNEDTSLVNNAKLSVRGSNRNAVFIGSPTLDSLGIRRSAFTGVIEPLWRENFANLDIVTDVDIAKVLLEQKQAGGEPVAVGVETKDGLKFHGSTVVVASGCIETPALLMRSGVGPEGHLRERGVGVKVANEHVGQHLRDKMLTDDMMLTDSTLGDFDQSLLIVNRIFGDGASVQLHRYDKSTVGNSYLAMTRLLRGSLGGGADGMKMGLSSALQYLSPAGYNAFCFQTYFKMKREANVTLDESLGARLDASALFAEAADDEAIYKARLHEIYVEIMDMRAKPLIQFKPCIPGILASPAEHMRMVWHFAGSCAAGKVVDPTDFSVMGTKGLHVADMSASNSCPDGGAMAMAYLTGHLAAEQMHMAAE
jgi:choline dehydrogenase-like flavoprotein